MFRDVHQAFSHSPNEHLTSAYMTRMTGKDIDYDMAAEYRRGVKLLLECFYSAAEEENNLTLKEKKMLYCKLRRTCRKNYGCSDNFLMDSFSRQYKYLRVLFFDALLILYRFYPLKFIYRLLKSAIVPGYAEKWRKNELD
jgi:hypothetical protein